jgi:hypothetical protein
VGTVADMTNGIMDLSAWIYKKSFVNFIHAQIILSFEHAADSRYPKTSILSKENDVIDLHKCMPINE